MFKTTSVMALGLFLGLAPVGALAQTETDDSLTQQQQLSEPATPETETQQQVTEPAMPETETQEELAEPATPETEADMAAQDVIPAQDDDEMLSSTIVGSSVMLADESIGSVSDLIIDADGMLKGIVVGVGGFLGIGEKRVALPMERITIRTPQPGEVELTADITREELEAKEAFRTAAQVRAQREAEQAEQQMQMEQPVTVD